MQSVDDDDDAWACNSLMAYEDGAARCVMGNILFFCNVPFCNPENMTLGHNLLKLRYEDDGMLHVIQIQNTL